MKNDQQYLEHILECIGLIQSYADSGRQSLDDFKTRDAVIRRLQVMAESTLRLSDETTAAYPEVGWQRIRNFRNRLVHEYLEVDIDLIWTIIERNLPSLKTATQAVLADLAKDDQE